MTTCGYSTPTPAIQVNNISVTEGQKAVFTVALTASNTSTTVNLSLLSGTATVGTASTNDVSSAMEYYNGSSWVPVINNTVTIGASSNSRNFQVRMQTLDNTIYEGSEQFRLRATANNVIATGTATINDNDAAPIIQSVSSVTVTEGQQAVFTIALAGVSSIATNVQLNLGSGSASIGNDTASNMQVSFDGGNTWSSASNGSYVSVAAGVQSMKVRVNTINDTRVENTETFTLTARTTTSMYCGGTTISSANGTGTILDNDTLAKVNSVSNVSVTEGGLAEFSVGLVSGNGATSVQLALAGISATAGADYTNAMQVSFDNGTTWSAVTGSAVNVAAGVQSFKVRVQTTDDTLVESTETFKLTAKTTTTSSCGGVTTNSTATGTASILDNDVVVPVLPTLAPISAATALEGNNVVFTVGLSGASTTATTVNLALSNGTTSAADLGALEYFNGSNWVAATGNQAIIAAGQTSVQVRTLAVADGVYEGLESFTLQASANGSTQSGQGSITDVAPTLAPIAAATALEGNQVVFTVGLSGASTTATTVNLALSNGNTSAADLGGLEYFNGSNWVAATGNQAIIAAGQTSVQVRTLAVADGVYEGLESFTLQASANGSTQTANGSVNDVAPTLNPIAAATALEGNNVVFTVGLSGTSTTVTTVDLVLSNGTTSSADLGGLEYFDGSNWVAATGNQAVIAAGQTSVQVRTLAVADGVYEGLESFTLQASANGSTQTANGSVTDVAPTLAPIAAATALEGNNVVFTVGLSGASTTATNVALVLSNGTTSSADLGGLEYFDGSNWVAATGNQAVIAAGQTSVQVRTLAVADGVYEGLESFMLQASANGSTQTANGSVTDIAPTLQPIAAATALEGNQVVFTVGLSGTSTTATNVDLVLSNDTTSAADLGGLEYFDGSNWVAATGNQAVIAAGQTSVQVRTLAVADGVYEGLESFTLQASANGSTQSGQGSITDVAPTLAPIAAATALEGNQVVFTVGLSGASTTATTVNLTLSNGTTSSADLGGLEYFDGSNWVAATGNQAVIAAGQTSVQVRTLAVADGVYEGLESFTLQASANGSTQTANGTVTDVAPALQPIDAATALEGNNVVFTVGLSGASTTATNVDLVLSNGTTSSADLGGLEYFDGSNWVAATGNQAIIAAGQTSVQVRTLAVADGVYEGLESFTLQASANGSTQTANGSITDVAPTLAPIAAATALEGNNVVFTVGLFGASTTATTVDLALSNGNTSAADLGGLEYFDGSNWMAAIGNQAVIAAGQTSVQVRTLAVADGVYEGLESFTLQASANGSTQSGQGSITDLPTTIPIVGTTGNDTLTGTTGDDSIYGNGGDDVISGGSGNDNIFAGSPTNPVGGFTTIYGDGGDDILTGGSASVFDTGSSTGVNFLNGTNDTLLGVGEHDTLVGGGIGSFNQFYLGSAQGSYYVGGGNADYASISNFDSSIDVIQLAGTSGDYSITYAGGIAALSHVNINESQDLIAKIDSAPNALDLNGGYFSYV